MPSALPQIKQNEFRIKHHPTARKQATTGKRKQKEQTNSYFQNFGTGIIKGKFLSTIYEI